MPVGVVLEPGAVKVMKVWLNAAMDEVPNATPRMEMAKPRESFRKDGLKRCERNSALTAWIRDIVIG